jgi:putative transcriptional regulator
MIVVNLDVMLAKRKMSLTELTEKMGITFSNMSILKNGRSRSVKIHTMNKLCKILDCQPGDLFEYREVDGEDFNLEPDWEKPPRGESGKLL